MSTADFSTVFRATSVLEKEGRLVRVELGDGKVRYEPSGTHHDHIQCRSCGVVVAVAGCLVAEANEQVARRTGFEVENHQLLFTGRCPSCQVL